MLLCLNLHAMLQKEVTNESELPEVALAILLELKEPIVVVFEGEMGAGKTTLIKAICNQLGCVEEGSSPTYSIVNEYLTSSGDYIYHFDCYRLKSENEALDIGFDEYVDSGNYCFIEWPDKVQNLLPDNYVRIQVEVKGNTRLIKLCT